MCNTCFSTILLVVCLLDFEIVDNNVAMDQSGYGNNGYLDNGPILREHPQICGHYIDMTEQGTVILPDRYQCHILGRLYMIWGMLIKSKSHEIS